MERLSKRVDELTVENERLLSLVKDSGEYTCTHQVPIALLVRAPVCRALWYMFQYHYYLKKIERGLVVMLSSTMSAPEVKPCPRVTKFNQIKSKKQVLTLIISVTYSHPSESENFH